LPRRSALEPIAGDDRREFSQSDVPDDRGDCAVSDARDRRSVAWMVHHSAFDPPWKFDDECAVDDRQRGLRIAS
jgi:hypothetical protein